VLQAAAQRQAAAAGLVASHARRLGQLQQHLGYCLALTDGLEEDEEEEASQQCSSTGAGRGEEAGDCSLLQEALRLASEQDMAGSVCRLAPAEQQRLQRYLQHALSPARLHMAAAPAQPLRHVRRPAASAPSR
jgi:hypothetical protein